MSSRPLISFVLISYKQEKFIREALEGAFSQTYSPLEIILSDDCSPDRTFEIMQEMVAAYRGPHKLILSRNEKNLGLGSHFAKVCGMCHGVFVVFAAGDDVAIPHRVEKLYQMWDAVGRKAVSIYSSADPIDASGNPYVTSYEFAKPCHPKNLEEVIRMETAHVVGATQGVSRVLIDSFGPFREAEIHDDEVLPFRALLLDGIHFCPEVLVKYRHHASNYWSVADRVIPFEDLHSAAHEGLAKLERNYRATLGIRRQWLADYETFGAPDKRYHARLERLVALAQHQLAVIRGSLLESIGRILLYGLRTGKPRGARILIYRTKLKRRICARPST